MKNTSSIQIERSFLKKIRFRYKVLCINCIKKCFKYIATQFLGNEK